ncbi:MAG: NADP-dependent malic enzyme [Deltaproteobacteria bacterium]|nr:NADP-dependent malic enzyme [Deltaproteobacteria bacterium]
MADDRTALQYHAEPRPGKIAVVPTKPLDTQRDLSLAYTPGVADACRAIAADPDAVFQYTAKGNLVAVVTNGTAVLGLGDIGPMAGKPVMEGKANLFKKFADIDVFDIELDARTVDEVVAVVKAMAPTFGGINLEDIKAPECFEIERRLVAELDIPVFHDDQHGTAIISAAAVLNATHIAGRPLSECRIVFSGAGAAAIACARLYCSVGALASHIVLVDTKGVVHTGRKDLNPEKEAFATTLPARTLAEALVGAHIFVGLSVANVLTAEMLQGMADKPIILAMANPDPEIPYDVAREARPDAIVATGRSDHPNQVNNVLGFPFVFRGALDCRARKITEEMKVAATRALAALAREDVPDSVLRAYGLEELTFGPDYIIPKPFDPRVLLWVAPAVAEAAAASGVAREPLENLEAYREWLHRLVERSRGLMSPLFRRAKSGAPKRIIFTEGMNPQVLRAVMIAKDEGLATPVLLGDEAKIRKRAAELRFDLAGIEVIDNRTAPITDDLGDRLWKLRQRKGLTLSSARARLRDPLWFAVMMVQSGMADGMVGGLGRAYKALLKPALQLIGADANSNAASGVYVMIFQDRMLFLGDPTVNLHPTAERIAEIALNTARVAETFGQKPQIAMLSYSDFGEYSDDPEVARVRRAIEIVRERRPELEIEGEMQADTAVNWEKHTKYFPFSRLTGPANILIFPDLTPGNIAYKLLENLTGAQALGPLVVGLRRPVSVIPVHATVQEIVNITAYTVNQALDLDG